MTLFASMLHHFVKAGSTLNWSWLKWDRQLEKISNFSVSQSDESDVANIDWLKTRCKIFSVLSWIVVARFVIDRISLLAYVANIYTILARNRQNLLLLWMVLSLFKNIALEITVIVITFLLWHKGNISTSLLVKFIAEKTIWLDRGCLTYAYRVLCEIALIVAAFSSCKWCTTLKWYTQLQRMAKIRHFAIIARTSIASFVPGRAGHSLDDECLGVAISRRGKYASLVYLGRLSEQLASRANAKSLTSLVTEDTKDDANDDNSDANDLSVAEKSMRMLNVTAEDVMDARARIQERSYWDEQDAITKTPEALEVAQFPLEKDDEGMIDKSTTVDRASRKEDIMGSPEMKNEEGKKKLVLPRNQEHIALTKSNDVTSDKMDNRAKSTESRVAPKKKRGKEEEGVAKIVQCPSFQSARNTEAKPCASLVRKLEARLYPIPASQREKWTDRVDGRRHQLTPTDSGASKKERYKNSKTSCACHRALRNSWKKHTQSIGNGGKNVDVNGKEFRISIVIPIVNMQRSKLDKTAFKYSETYRLKKQIENLEESRRKRSWESRSLAQTARPSGYARNVIDASDKLSTVNCRRNVQAEIRDESKTTSDSLSERYGLKHKQLRSRRSADLRSVYNVASFREKNYAEARETKTKTSEICNNFTSTNNGGTRARRSRKLSIEEGEAMRAYNELTLSEAKRELEVREERDSSLNYGRLTEESEVVEMKVSKTCNDPTLPEDKEETKHNLSPSSQRSVDERSATRARNELTRSGSEREPRAERKGDLSRDETPSECEEHVETSVSNRLSIDSYYENITSPVIHRNANRGSSPSDRCARHIAVHNMSLNLREMTRNIECTAHPRGIVLTNKNLHGRFLEKDRSRESQQRDIVDDNTVSTLHSAFFFKPEIITRAFRRAQARLDESFPSFSTFRRESTEFACRINNEMGNDRNTLADSVFSNANDNRDTRGERGHDLCIIFVGRERIPSESETVIAEDPVGSQVNARSSIESTSMNILIFDQDCDRTESAIDLPARLITGVPRDDIETSERGMRDVASPNQENVSNVSVYNNSQSRESNADAINLDEENNKRNNAYVADDTVHEIERTLNSNDNCPANVTSYGSLEKLHHSRDENAIDIHSKNENNSSLKSTCNDTTLQLSDNNNNFDKTEKSMFNRAFKNSSKLSVPGPSLFIKSDNHALRSCDEELEKLTQLSDSATSLNDQRKESISNLKTTNCDTISQFRNVESLKLETTIRDGARSTNESREVYEETSQFLAEKIFKMHSDDNLQRDDSFYCTYERNDDPGTPVSLEDGSLMEEFLSDPIPHFNSSCS
ncbi:PREDICTED: uncharacterized protein LOC105569308 [Vollenhovia emeryi]|uniref:uncharacterized protein LOC105569308 n=1 Tax=Vollenhovia emeryi TaxID=411798 RepID=UPI0005F485F7|nr:PREDICTED: uncharacterized protein LOC105569308 [Vollenhovia emeryi]